ncbi:MAG TPA: N-formylglutamate amidohydrolase [Allosphingosinicella sp.]|jgi:N-formylglutamate amidohydrolase
MADPQHEPPFLRVGPQAPQSPVVLSVPHAGRAYAPDLLGASRVPMATLELLEDRLVDRLVWRAIAGGASALIALRPRAEIDLNRDEREIDPAMVAPPPSSRALIQSQRTRGGLGLVPSRIAGAGAIWNRRLPAGELARRIAQVHRPYHDALARLLEETRNRFGIAILLDCHSMPPRSGGSPAEQAGIVLGDLYGTSIAPEYVDVAGTAARRFGFKVARNEPYAGGYVTQRHGRPAEGVHALQLEVDRSLYLDEGLRDLGSGFDTIAGLIAAIASALAARALEPPQALAAE